MMLIARIVMKFHLAERIFPMVRRHQSENEAGASFLTTRCCASHASNLAWSAGGR